VSKLPSHVAARCSLVFPELQNQQQLESFFLGLSLSVFDSSCRDGKFIGHIKFFGEGGSKSVIRANVTGIRANAEVEVRYFHPERQVNIWVNIIAYHASSDALRKRFLRSIIQQTRDHCVKVRGLRVVEKHGHQ
jgi:hypothetical protein